MNPTIDVYGVSHNAYNWIADNPERFVMWLTITVLIVWAICTMLWIRWDEKRRKLRGNKMTAKQRRAWLKRWKADIVVDAFEAQYKKGVICEAELREVYRSLSNELRLPDLKTRKLYNIAEVSTPTNAFKNWPPTNTKLKEHLALVKAFIQKRMSWKMRAFLYHPVTIPGPPIPAVKVKMKRKGALLGRTK